MLWPLQQNNCPNKSLVECLSTSKFTQQSPPVYTCFFLSTFNCLSDLITLQMCCRDGSVGNRYFMQKVSSSGNESNCTLDGVKGWHSLCEPRVSHIVCQCQSAANPQQPCSLNLSYQIIIVILCISAGWTSSITMFNRMRSRTYNNEDKKKTIVITDPSVSVRLCIYLMSRT